MMDSKREGVGNKEEKKRKVDKEEKEEVEDDVLGANPMLASSSIKGGVLITQQQKKKLTTITRKDTSDDFLDHSPFTITTTTTTPPKKKDKPAPSSSSPSSSSPSPSSSSSSLLRRSASADSDDFLDIDPFSTPTNNKSGVKRGLETEENEEEKVKRLKTSLEKELEPAIPHLQGVWKGTIHSELAAKYKKGGKDRKGMKWNLSTGGFSEQEFDLIIELLKKRFPKCDLHYITDVLWQEAAVKLLMERKKLRSQQTAVKILKTVELSSVDKKELRRYQSDPSLLAAVAKYQHEIGDSPDSKSPNSSQDKKKSKSPSSSQEKPSSQERKSDTKTTSTFSKFYQTTFSTTTTIDLSKHNFKKQNITSNNNDKNTTNTEAREKEITITKTETSNNKTLLTKARSNSLDNNKKTKDTENWREWKTKKSKTNAD